MILIGTDLSFADSPSKPQDVIRKQLEDCVNAHPTNPGVIACNQTAISQANQAIQDSVAVIKSHLSLSVQKAAIDNQVQSFQVYRKSSGLVSAIANGGTGSDQQLADTSAQAELTLRELQDLREEFSLDPNSGK